MSDQSLLGDDLKVVQYSILSIEADREHIYPGFPRTKLVKDAMTGEDFVTWVIAEFVQEHKPEIPHHVKQYLRVCWQVQCRFAKEASHYDRDSVQLQKAQIGVLEQINHTLKESSKSGK